MSSVPRDVLEGKVFSHATSSVSIAFPEVYGPPSSGGGGGSGLTANQRVARRKPRSAGGHSSTER